MYDVAVIGGGPAGLSAAINVRQRGGTVLVISTAVEGNPLYMAERIDNYPGIPGVSGRELLGIYRRHAESMGVEFLEARVLNAMANDGEWMLSAGDSFAEALAVVFAGGVVRGKKYPGEEALLGRGVSYCATCDGMLYRGKEVAVIGFSDGDRKEADYLSGIGCRVHWFRKPKAVTLEGAEKLERITVDGETVEAAGVFILRPSLAPTELFPELDLADGYVRVDRRMATNLPGLYAAGDCTGAPLQAAKAVGEGLIAGQQAMAWAAKQKKARS